MLERLRSILAALIWQWLHLNPLLPAAKTQETEEENTFMILAVKTAVIQRRKQIARRRRNLRKLGKFRMGSWRKGIRPWREDLVD